MEKKNLDWSNLTFSYQKTDKRFVANYKNGAWDEGAIIDDDMMQAFSSMHRQYLKALRLMRQ